MASAVDQPNPNGPGTIGVDQVEVSSIEIIVGSDQPPPAEFTSPVQRPPPAQLPNPVQMTTATADRDGSDGRGPDFQAPATPPGSSGGNAAASSSGRRTSSVAAGSNDNEDPLRTAPFPDLSTADTPSQSSLENNEAEPSLSIYGSDLGDAKVSVPTIVGSVLGSLAFISFLACLLLYLRRRKLVRRRTKTTRETKSRFFYRNPAADLSNPFSFYANEMTYTSSEAGNGQYSSTPRTSSSIHSSRDLTDSPTPGNLFYPQSPTETSGSEHYPKSSTFSDSGLASSPETLVDHHLRDSKSSKPRPSLSIASDPFRSNTPEMVRHSREKWATFD